MRWGPWDVYFSSVCRTPIWKPRALAAETARSASARCCSMGRMEGVLDPVSLKYLPVSMLCQIRVYVTMKAQLSIKPVSK